jgi:hypothetical protein
MKKYINTQFPFLKRTCLALALLSGFNPGSILAQDTTAVASTADSIGVSDKKGSKPVKNTFGSVWLMDNQTVMVPIKGTLEMDIQHRFGTIENGRKDVFGLFAPSNIRMGMTYSPINKLFVGAGLTKERMQVDLNAKIGLLLQTIDGKMPVSVTYFGNMVIDARDKSFFRYAVHRFSYFNQVLIARKITEKLSLQVAPSFSWFNNIEGYVDSQGNVQNKMENGHLAISALGRYKVSDQSAVTVGYDQPLTQHPTNNPHPNIAFGFETTTSAHAFQVFMGTYYGIVPQSNNMFNQNDYRNGQFVIGFNISRLWNF